MITGCVVINIAHVDSFTARETYKREKTDRYLLDRLRSVPDGARVIVDIGDRRYVSQDAATWLHDHDHRLEIEVRGSDSDAVAAFIRAGRAGEWPVGA